jgi:uncharacterized protein
MNESIQNNIELEYRQLDPRVVDLWQVSNLIEFGILMLVLLMGALIGSLIVPNAMLFFIIGWSVLAIFFVWYSFWYPPRAYRAWSYKIDERVLETRSGIIFWVVQLLPLTRLQHVDLERGPIERRYGLTTLVLHTAGTHASTITIPGLAADEAVRLRDHLVEVGGDDAV